MALRKVIGQDSYPEKCFILLDRDFVKVIKDDLIKVLVEKQNYIGEYVPKIHKKL